ncbi:hypothetical protein [Paenibacillus graminis]|uniref:hypothetical protein n=1 Tax=Paenibacillus graminis TaxID=189425 RepID=UPI002DBA6E14|nr:hypothetical protein [Paenibacillus graminis]MEC0169910.1 hypothetical protein [Paenibacillus graminis]
MDIQINGQKFEDLIARHGRDVLWQESIRCSCINLDSGQPRYGCLICGGTGFVYEPVKTCRALVQSVTTSKDYLAYAGMFEVGDALMSVPANMFLRTPDGGFIRSGREPVPMFNIGAGDVVTLIDDEVKTSEVLIKDTELHGRPADTLLNPKVTKVLSVRMHDPNTAKTTLYVAGEDYEVEGAEIVWTGNQPPAGAQYSVMYMHRPVYTVYTVLPRPRHQNNQDLPRTVLLRYYPGGVLREHSVNTS